MKKFNVLLAISTLGLTATAFGQESEGPFSKLDTDGNGTISFAEFQENGRNPLLRLDANDDGALSLEEFLSARPPRHRSAGGDEQTDESADAENQAQRAEQFLARITEQFQVMDLDGDDLVSTAELQEAAFLRMDSDNNGALTMDEMRSARGPGERRRGGRRGERPPAD